MVRFAESAPPPVRGAVVFTVRVVSTTVVPLCKRVPALTYPVAEIFVELTFARDELPDVKTPVELEYVMVNEDEAEPPKIPKRT